MGAAKPSTLRVIPASSPGSLDTDLLHLLRRLHESGEQRAVLAALDYCARSAVALPRWLAEAVGRAIRTVQRGEPDEILGLGNERFLAKWRRESVEARNVAIRETFTELGSDAERPRGVTKQKLIEALAELHHLSPKAIEKIIYKPGSPTRSTKK